MTEESQNQECNEQNGSDLFAPKILPKWTNKCKTTEDDTNQNQIFAELTDSNAYDYVDISSSVGWRKRVNYAVGNLRKDRETQADNSLLSRLLESVISTVIIMASDGIPARDYLFSTALFLGTVENDYGEHPPNIAAFLELVQKNLSAEDRNALDSVDKIDFDELPPNLVITRIPKNLQQKP